MKCEIVKDLLPLYMDKLTSRESNLEIEAHLQKCQSCRDYYQEMQGDLPQMLPKAQVDETALIKKVRKRRRRVKCLVLGMIFFLCLLLAGSILVLRPSTVSSSEVELLYGREGDRVYAQMKESKNRNIQFTGSVKSIKDDQGNTIGEEMYLKTLTSFYTPRQGGGCSWEGTVDENHQIIRWIFEFKDKIITIENGELILEEEKGKSGERN